MSLKRQRGATLLEFALVIITLFMLMFGIMDFSRAAYAYHFVSAAAREGARYASVHGHSYFNTNGGCPNDNYSPPPLACDAREGDSVGGYVRSIVPAGIFLSAASKSSADLTDAISNPGDLQVLPVWNPPGTSTPQPSFCTNSPNQPDMAGCVVQIQVNYIFGFSLPLLGTVKTIHMSSTSQMVITQ